MASAQASGGLLLPAARGGSLAGLVLDSMHRGPSPGMHQQRTRSASACIAPFEVNIRCWVDPAPAQHEAIPGLVGLGSIHSPGCHPHAKHQRQPFMECKFPTSRAKRACSESRCCLNNTTCSAATSPTVDALANANATAHLLTQSEPEAHMATLRFTCVDSI